MASYVLTLLRTRTSRGEAPTRVPTVWVAPTSKRRGGYLWGPRSNERAPQVVEWPNTHPLRVARVNPER